MSEPTPRRLLAFGGPLNESFVTVSGGMTRVLAPVYPRPSLARSYDPSSAGTADVLRAVTYTVERVAHHDARKCAHIAPMHSDDCRWEARCLIADGYPMHRVTDTLNAIAGMTRILTA